MIEFCSATLKHYYYVIYPVDKSGPSSYGSWIYSYLCNQCLSPLMLWVWISIRARCTALCDKVCQWLATSWWFSLGPLVSSNNNTDRHDITEILLKVALDTIKQTNNIDKVFFFFFQLRLLYESNPMAYLIEQAGGLATTGKERILELQPSSLHERCPVFMGSKDDVQDVLDMYKMFG